jgi:Escherichia/Staphylococcus phage prohead protease
MAKTIKGYAAIFDSPAFVPDNRRGRDGGFYETIRRGAFTSALKSGGDVMAVIDHDPSRILGRLSAGNLTLSEDKRGLYYVITPPDDVSYVRDLLANISAGNVRGSSFSFSVDDGGQEWTHSNGQLHRDIRSVTKLSDVSVVTQPVYPATDGLVSARSGIPALEPFELSQERHEKQLRREPRSVPQVTSGRSWRDCKQIQHERKV